jgi:hypothetical protein
MRETYTQKGLQAELKYFCYETRNSQEDFQFTGRAITSRTRKLRMFSWDGNDFGDRQIYPLGHYCANFLFSSRYFSLERRYAAMTSGRTIRCEGTTLCR